MSEHNCDNCSFRAKYDNNPQSYAGRLWRWHINFCPGWKRYFISLPHGDKTKIAEKYSFIKYQ